MNEQPIVTEQINKGSQQKENKMDNEKLNKLAGIAVEDMKRAAGRLTEIQSACRHKDENQHIEFINGITSLTCKVCYKVIGIPTKQQLINAGFTI